MEYPLFKPPFELAEKPRKEWSNKEAKAYFEWFVGNIDTRVAGLLFFLGLDDNLDTIELLRVAQEKLEVLLNDNRFCTTESESKKLSNEGYALAADIGLLLAKRLIAAGDGKVRWEILKKPKSDASYNLPVLVSSEHSGFDPIAGSIAVATSILRGNKKEDAWVKVFQFLVNV